jgi:hypothetical protein
MLMTVNLAWTVKSLILRLLVVNYMRLVWKEAIVAYYDGLFKRFPGETGEGKKQYPPSNWRGISRIR